MDNEQALRRLRVLRTELEQQVEPLLERHRSRLHCGLGCHDCCADDLTVLPVEALAILRSHGPLLEHGTPHPEGRCAFLDAQGACRIYTERPYVCRTQGLPLRYFEEDDEEEVHERRDICPHNLAGEPLSALDDAGLWLIGPHEVALSDLQFALAGDEEGRVSLRGLFRAAQQVTEG